MIYRNKTALFLTLTFGICYLLALIFKWAGLEYSGISATVFAVIYMLIPMLVVFLIERVIYKHEITTHLFLSFKLNWWFLVALLTPLFIAFGSLGVSLLLPQVNYSPDMTGFFERYRDIIPPEAFDEAKQSITDLPISLFWVSLISGLFSGISINAAFAFGEELGWRAFLLRQFEHLKFLKAALIIGFIWGIWHAPLILMGHNYPNHHQLGVLYMIIFCVLLTPIFIYIVLKTKSVIAAAVMHGTINGIAGVPLLVITGGNDLMVGITGYAGFITIAVLLLLLFIYDWFISKEKLFAKTLIAGF